MKCMQLLVLGLFFHSLFLSAEPVIVPGLYFGTHKVAKPSGGFANIYALLFIGSDSRIHLSLIETPFRQKTDIASYKRNDVLSVSSSLRVKEGINNKNKIMLTGEASVSNFWGEVTAVLSQKEDYLSLKTRWHKSGERTNLYSQFSNIALAQFIPLNHETDTTPGCHIPEGTVITSESPLNHLSFSINFLHRSIHTNTGVSASLTIPWQGETLTSNFSEGYPALNICDGTSLTTIHDFSRPLTVTGQVFSLFDAPKNRYITFGLLQESPNNVPALQQAFDTSFQRWFYPSLSKQRDETEQATLLRRNNYRSYLLFPAKRAKHWKVPAKAIQPNSLPHPEPTDKGKSFIEAQLPTVFLTASILFSVTLILLKQRQTPPAQIY